MNDMKIKLQPRVFYGKSLYTPMCDTSRLLLKMQRSRSGAKPMFTKKEIGVLKDLGYEIELIPYMEPI